MQENNRNQKHAEIALAIKAAKKRMFLNSRSGMQLREAADKFALDVVNRLDAIIPRDENSLPESQPKSAEVLPNHETALKLLDAINESRTLLIEHLHKTADPSTGDPEISDFRKDAEFFLSCVIHRFENVAPERTALFHSYDVSDALRRFGTAADRTFGNARLDEIVELLISESRRLIEGQYCQQCEHCIAIRPDGRTEPISTDYSLDADTLSYAIERAGEHLGPRTDGGQETIALLRHIQSMAAVNRPGAIQNVIRKLLDAIVENESGAKHKVALRDELVAEAFKDLARAKRWHDDPEACDREWREQQQRWREAENSDEPVEA